MKTLLCLIAFVMMAIPATQAQTTRIALLSDTHLLAPELFDRDNTAFRTMASTEMRLVEHSDEIIKAMIDTILTVKPQLVAITGDLTHNGERASHLRLVEHLRRLRQAGINVLVIPGNHDISNPFARAFHAEKPEYVPTITRDEFADIYADMGYALRTTVRDTASLSYACEPVDGLVVLALDSNRDEENQLIARGDNRDRYNSAGRLRPETLDWACRQADMARRNGKHVVALMHHHLLEHFDGEARFLPNYVVGDNNHIAQTLADAGVKVIFTGHLHITDAAASADRRITDIATGTATSYPFAIRFADVDGSALRVSTSFLALPQYQEQGRRQIVQGVPGVANMFINRLWSRIASRRAALVDLLADENVDTTRIPASPKQLNALIFEYMRQPLTESLLMFSRGGERPSQAQAIIGTIRDSAIRMIGDILPTQAEHIIPFVDRNLLPQVEPILRSAIEDRNHFGTPDESATHDHVLTIPLR